MRLFIAINLPSSLRQSIWQAAVELRARDYPIRWVAEEAIHLTIKFLGDVDPAKEDDVVTAMESAVAGVRRFTLPISGFGAFPSARKPRVVWVGCDAVPTLELVQHQLEQRLDQLGFPPEGRPFRPHLTLGRVRREARDHELRGIEVVLGQTELDAESVVSSVDLMQSELSRTGARYTRRRAVELEV